MSFATRAARLPLLRPVRSSLDRRAGREPALPPSVVGIVLGGVIVLIMGSYLAGPPDRAHELFLEEGPITLVSSLLMAATASLSGAAFLLRDSGERQRWFWFATAVGFLFFALDERMTWHEAFGSWLKHEAFGPASSFRNWNDVVVIVYGVIALIVLAWFLPEILRWAGVAELLAAGFGLFALHTFLDTIATDASTIVPEESAKLGAAACFALAALAGVMAIARDAPSPDHD